jgi:hypothetical protein
LRIFFNSESPFEADGQTVFSIGIVAIGSHWKIFCCFDETDPTPPTVLTAPAIAGATDTGRL